MKIFFIWLIILLSPLISSAQNSNNINGNNEPLKYFYGKHYNPGYYEASRFLLQAGFGGNMQMIKKVADMGIEPWIDWQMNIPPKYLLPQTDSIFKEIKTDYPWLLPKKAKKGKNKKKNKNPLRPNSLVVSFAWWENYMHSEDVLRQRIAFALSEIFVISNQSKLKNFGYATSSFYDIFLRNAFGNFRDILEEVTFHPAMGYYLTYLKNRKADPTRNIHPDENYARELMQLFTIGLYQLNQDGTVKTGNNGLPIPTYDNNDITEFSKVFTGLSFGGVIDNDVIKKPRFNMGYRYADWTVPMKMYPKFHDTGVKHLLNGYTIPAGVWGIRDIERTLDLLFNHPNVGPFIAKKLIQFLVKSNPSPGYVAAVASAFNNNGHGVRGDMKAVIKAILLNPEARNYNPSDTTAGKLLEPFVRYVHFNTAIGVSSPSGKYWNSGRLAYKALQQYPLESPTVFNFFLPEFQPIGPISDAGLVAPEFQITNSRSSISYVNLINRMAVKGIVAGVPKLPEMKILTDYDQLKKDALDNDTLLNKLDLLLTYGSLSNESREIIKNAISGLKPEDKIRMAVYLIMISPDYVILK